MYSVMHERERITVSHEYMYLGMKRTGAGRLNDKEIKTAMHA